ncbi:hypothetical protein KP509_28G025200 [Ceratopteris richardii]|nr:hypothetical protein KP509_28G025200 [Ceratopteris richardii]
MGRLEPTQCLMSVKRLMEEEVGDALPSEWEPALMNTELIKGEELKIGVPKYSLLDKDQNYKPKELNASENRSNCMQVKVSSDYEDLASQEPFKEVSHYDIFSSEGEAKDLLMDACDELRSTLTTAESITRECRYVELPLGTLEEGEKRTKPLNLQETDYQNEERILAADYRHHCTMESASDETNKVTTKRMAELSSEVVVPDMMVQDLKNVPVSSERITGSDDCSINFEGSGIGVDDVGEKRRHMLKNRRFIFFKEHESLQDAATTSSGIHADGLRSVKEYNFPPHRHLTHISRVQAKVEDATYDKEVQASRSAEQSRVGNLRQESTCEIPTDLSLGLIKNAYDVLDDGIPHTVSRTATDCMIEVSHADRQDIVKMKQKCATQHINGINPIKFVFRSMWAHEITPRDMDELLEKLASEFERQESLACSTV